MMQCSENVKGDAKPTSLLTPRTTTRVATWNIWTMYKAGRSIQVTREMKNYKTGVLEQSEARWLQTGQLRLSFGKQFLY
jgi:hypothetical protein